MIYRESSETALLVTGVVILFTFTLLPLVLMVYLWCKTPLFYDVFKIRTEMYACFVCVCIKTIALIGYFIIDFTYNFEKTSLLNTIRKYYFLFEAFVNLSCDFSLVMIVTLYVVHQMTPIIASNPQLNRINTYYDSLNDGNRSKTPTRNNNRKNKNNNSKNSKKNRLFPARSRGPTTTASTTQSTSLNNTNAGQHPSFHAFEDAMEIVQFTMDLNESSVTATTATTFFTRTSPGDHDEYNFDSNNEETDIETEHDSDHTTTTNKQPQPQPLSRPLSRPLSPHLVSAESNHSSLRDDNSNSNNNINRGGYGTVRFKEDVEITELERDRSRNNTRITRASHTNNISTLTDLSRQRNLDNPDGLALYDDVHIPMKSQESLLTQDEIKQHVYNDSSNNLVGSFKAGLKNAAYAINESIGRIKTPTIRENQRFGHGGAGAGGGQVKQLKRNNSKAISLEKILSHSQSFELFMQHLSREFSMENLLSLLEFTQFMYFVRGRVQLLEKSQNETWKGTTASYVLVEFNFVFF